MLDTGDLKNAQSRFSKGAVCVAVHYASRNFFRKAVCINHLPAQIKEHNLSMLCLSPFFVSWCNIEVEAIPKLYVKHDDNSVAHSFSGFGRLFS